MQLYLQTIGDQMERDEITFNYGDANADGYICAAPLVIGKNIFLCLHTTSSHMYYLY